MDSRSRPQDDPCLYLEVESEAGFDAAWTVAQDSDAFQASAQIAVSYGLCNL